MPLCPRLLLCLLIPCVLAAAPRPPDIPLAQPLPFKPSLKRGVGHWSSPEAGKPAGEGSLPGQVVDDLKLAWYYNWVTAPKPDEAGLKAEFVPMAWDEKYVDDKTLSPLKSGPYKVLLGFNEPDNEGQAEMTLSQVVSLWPKLEATGLRLGSPGATHAPWHHRFMEQAARRGLKVDFVALHHYPDISQADAVEGLRNFLRAHWLRWRKPLWLTEYSGANWKWHERAVTMEDNARFARDSCLLMESLPYVERYAWFSSGPGAREGKGFGGYAPTSLYVKRGQLAPAGLAYRDAMLRPDQGLRWQASPLDGAKPPARGKTLGFDLWPDGNTMDAKVEFEGLLQIEKAGRYAFQLLDPDTSFTLGGTPLAQGPLGAAKPNLAAIELAPGRHRINVTLLRRGEHPRLRILYSGPGLPLQPLPLDKIFLPL